MDSLQKFAEHNNVDTVNLTDIGEVHPQFQGESCWERNHPTFISKKRKVILTTPRKVGHSSIRFYLHAQNEINDDDWIWIEDSNRNPKSWLEPDEYHELVSQMYQQDVRKIVCTSKLSHHDENNLHSKTAEIMTIGSEECKKFFGEYNRWDWASEIAPDWMKNREFDMTPPLQTLPFFDDWTSYLIVRDPMDRFISGLITEMDNGMTCPWLYDAIAHTKEGWEKYYNSAKRMLYFTHPEHLLLGGMDGIQMNHTFALSRPMWDGKTMFDTYDKLVPYKHDIDYIADNDGRLNPTTESLLETRGVIEELERLEFIGLEVAIAFSKNAGQLNQTTHLNITPTLRQQVIDELQEDEDLKEWWERCREIVDWDTDSIKNNQQKF